MSNNILGEEYLIIQMTDQGDACKKLERLEMTPLCIIPA